MVELSQLCLAIVDCEHKTAPKSYEGYPLIRTTDIGRGRLDLSNVQRVDAEAYEEWTRRAVPQPGDLILAREAPVGNVAIVTSGLEPVLGQRTVLIRPDLDLVDPDYLTYRLLAYDLQHWMKGVANGSTVPHLNMEDIRSLPMPALPRLDEQRAIGGALAAFDDLIENNRRRIEILEEIARLIYREWFVHFRFPGHENVELVDSGLGPIPEGWEVAAIEDLCTRLQAGSTPKRSEDRFWDGHDVDWFTTGELQDDFLFASEEGLSSEGAENGRIFDAGTILMAIYGSPTVGRLGVLTQPASCNQAALGFVADPMRTSQVFLYYKLLELRVYFNSIAQGAAQQNISKVKVAKTTVALPPSDLQQQFVDIVTPIWSLQENLGGQVKLLIEARDLLLPRLISGEMDVSGLDLDLEPVA